MGNDLQACSLLRQALEVYVWRSMQSKQHIATAYNASILRHRMYDMTRSGGSCIGLQRHLLPQWTCIEAAYTASCWCRTSSLALCAIQQLLVLWQLSGQTQLMICNDCPKAWMIQAYMCTACVGHTCCFDEQLIIAASTAGYCHRKLVPSVRVC
jgi:hypothetical protein